MHKRRFQLIGQLARSAVIADRDHRKSGAEKITWGYPPRYPKVADTEQLDGRVVGAVAYIRCWKVHRITVTFGLVH